ncbi:MAG: hypothetical protein KGJ35_00050 [Patescibacteria group bacterium]|nr:hypothetical protein [Patescibacteria group bacterium]
MIIAIVGDGEEECFVALLAELNSGMMKGHEVPIESIPKTNIKLRSGAEAAAMAFSFEKSSANPGHVKVFPSEDSLHLLKEFPSCLLRFERDHPVTHEGHLTL